MTKKLNFREMKNDIKQGYYEILDSQELCKKFYVTVLNEDDTILIAIDNFNTMTQGTYRIDKKEVLSMKKKEFVNLLNTINYYCNEPIESEC